MLQVKEVSKIYANNQVKAIDNVSFEVRPGEIFGFLGPNGAGKSTLIKMLTGILNINSGDIEVNGFSIKTNRINAQKNFGYVPDTHEIFDKMSGLEYVNFIADIHGVPKDVRQERLTKYLKIFGLTENVKKPIKSYSHGMKQKITIIGALIHNPNLWVLDEPMTGLDPQSSFELKKLMKEHKDAGKSVFFSSHVLEVVEKICDKIAIIDKGRLIAVGTIDEIKAKTDLSLEEFFMKVTTKSDDESESNVSGEEK